MHVMLSAAGGRLVQKLPGWWQQAERGCRPRQGDLGLHVVVAIDVSVLVSGVVGTVAVPIQVPEVVVAVCTSVSATCSSSKANQVREGTTR